MRTPHVRSFFSALEEKLSHINIFDAQNARRRTLFLELGLSFPALPTQNVENRRRKTVHFVILPEFRDHGHQLLICMKYRKFQRENCLDHRKTGIRHNFASRISMSQAVSAKEKPRKCGATVTKVLDHGYD